MTHYDLIIRNATVIDGTRAARFQGDVAVKGDRIAAVGRLERAGADGVLTYFALDAAKVLRKRSAG